MAPKTFFELPAEVRNIIYRLAFQRPTDVIPTLVMRRDQAAFKPGQVLRISKTFNIEAAPFVYGTRNFAFNGIFHAIRFLVTIGKSYSALLISIDLGHFLSKEFETTCLCRILRYGFEDALATTSKLLAQSCPQLRYVRFSGQQEQHGTTLTRRTARLEGFQALTNAFPQLSNVSCVAGFSMHLTVPDITRPANAEIFDIANDIRKLKDEKKKQDEAARQKTQAESQNEGEACEEGHGGKEDSSIVDLAYNDVLQVLLIVLQHSQHFLPIPFGST